MWLVLVLAVTALAVSWLPSLEVRTDGESLHPRDHPTVVLSRQDRERFYEPEQVILLAHLGEGRRRWDDAAGMALLARLQHDLQRLPEVDNHQVRSAATLLAPPTEDGEDGAPMAVRRYLNPLPRTEAAAAEIAKRLHAHPLTGGLFLSEDGRLAAFYLALVPRERLALSRAAQLTALEDRLAALVPEGVPLELDLLGPSVAEARLGERVLADLARLLPGMLLVMVLVLTLALRSVAGVVVPLASAGIVLLWTFAAMAVAGVPLTLVTTIVPVVLVALAVTDEVHLLERLRSHLLAEPVVDRPAVRRATERALEQVGPPIVLTSLTTAAGFLSFLTASLPPVRDFGIFVALGILLALGFTFTFVPALLSALPPRWVAPRKTLVPRASRKRVAPRHEGLAEASGKRVAPSGETVADGPTQGVAASEMPDADGRRKWVAPSGEASVEGGGKRVAPSPQGVGGAGAGRAAGEGSGKWVAPLGWVERWAGRRPQRAALAGLVLLVLLSPGIVRLDVQDSWIANFAPDSPLVRADRLANDTFWGTYRMDVVLEHPDRDFFRTAPGLAVLERTRETARNAPHVAGVVTHLLPFEMIAGGRGLSAPLSAASESDLARIAGTAEAGARLIDLRWFLDPEARAARARLLVRHADYHKARELRQALEDRLPAILSGTATTFHLSGDLPLAVDVVDAVVGDQLRSMAWTLVAIALLVALAVRRPRPVLAILVPPLAAVAAVLGGMGWSGMPLGIATSTFAALTLGVGVDFGIHLESAFRRHRDAGVPPPAAMAAALAGCGRALRWNTAVLAAGFLVLTLSSLDPNRNLGLLLAAGLAASWLAAVLFLPVLLAPRPRHPPTPRLTR